MAPLKLFFLAITASVALAFTPSSSRVQKVTSSTQLYEDFGLGLGEPTYENQPDLLKGEEEYKKYVNKINEKNMLNRKVRNSSYRQNRFELRYEINFPNQPSSFGFC